jgi:hypothetical protein
MQERMDAIEPEIQALLCFCYLGITQEAIRSLDEKGWRRRIAREL